MRLPALLAHPVRYADGLDLGGLGVVMAGSYSDDEPSSPWRVALYVDDGATTPQSDAIADIFLGRAGGGTFANFAAAITEVYGVHRATIELDHDPRHRRIYVNGNAELSAISVVPTDAPIACGIPGLDRPGAELRAEVFLVDAGQLSWSLSGRCGFSSDFDYSGS